MERVAQRLYKGLLTYHPSRGGSDYRREFGFCIVEEVRLEDQESGDEVPSSTDEESEEVGIRYIYGSLVTIGHRLL